MPSRGKLIVFEGVEGVGKTTQIRLLSDWLGAQRLSYFVIREPGGTALGNEIRRLLLDFGAPVTERAEALLFMASRAQVVAEEIVPRLERGEIVVADRFFLSTYAYQCGGRGLPEQLVREANRLATGGLVPDLTLLMDLPVQDGLARVAQRGQQDRIEQSGSGFHDRVAAAFASFEDAKWQKAHPECGPVVLVDASGDSTVVHTRVKEALRSTWPETFTSVVEFQNQAQNARIS